MHHGPLAFSTKGPGYIRSLFDGQSIEKFVMVAFEYFAKWLEAKDVTIITQRSMAKFLWEHVICSFRVPYKIIVNNRPQLKGDYITLLCSNMHINLSSILVSHP